MDFNIELRYYEIVFHKIVLHYQRILGLDRLYDMVDLMVLMSGSDIGKMQQALKIVLTLDNRMNYIIPEYIICLKECTDFSDRAIAELLGCSHRTIQKAMKAKENGDLFIHPKMDIDISAEVRKCVKAFRELANIY